MKSQTVLEHGGVQGLQLLVPLVGVVEARPLVRNENDFVVFASFADNKFAHLLHLVRAWKHIETQQIIDVDFQDLYNIEFVSSHQTKSKPKDLFEVKKDKKALGEQVYLLYKYRGLVLCYSR